MPRQGWPVRDRNVLAMMMIYHRTMISARISVSGSRSGSIRRTEAGWRRHTTHCLRHTADIKGAVQDRRLSDAVS